MRPVSLRHAKSLLFQLVASIEQGRESEIVITRKGRPVAKLVPTEGTPSGKRIGVAKGLFDAPNCIDAFGDEVEHLFLGTRR